MSTLAVTPEAPRVISRGSDLSRPKVERGLAGIPEVRHAERLVGDPDYLLRIATTDLAAYQVLRDEKLAVLPGVQRLTSTIVMKRVVDDRPFPVAPPAGIPHRA